MLLVLVMFLAVAGPATLIPGAYADEDIPVEETDKEIIEEIIDEVKEEPAEVTVEDPVEEVAEEIEPAENTLSIVYNVTETESKGKLYGDMPSVVGGDEQQISNDENVTIRDLDATSYQTFTGNEKDRFPYYTYAFKGWTTEGGEILTPGSEVSAESLDADGDGIANLSSTWSGSWESGSGTPFVKYSIWTNAETANDCFENGTLLGENISNYSPTVGGSIMVALDEEGNTVTPDELTSPSHGNTGKPNVGDIYNNPDLNLPKNQGKYLMVSYLDSSVSEANEDIRTLAETGLRTTDSESGDVTWKLDNLPTDEEVLGRLSSFVSRGMTVLRDENGDRIQSDALTADNYEVLWCQVKYQSGKNDGWNINGVLSTKIKNLQEAVAEIIENIEPENVEPEVAEPENVEPEVVESDNVEPEVVESENIEPEVVESEPAEPEVIETKASEPVIAETAPATPAAPVAYVPAAPAVPVNAEPAAQESAEPVALTSGSRSMQTVSLASEHVESPAAPIVEVVAEPAIPTANFAPAAENNGRWAVLDLILLVLALYAFLPILSLRNKAESVKNSGKEGRVILAVEAILLVVGLISLLATQNLGAPMIFADTLSIPMAALAGAVCLIEKGMRKAKSARD